MIKKKEKIRKKIDMNDNHYSRRYTVLFGWYRLAYFTVVKLILCN